MQRRQFFLRSGLALGAAALLPGAGLTASDGLSPAPAIEMTFSELIQNKEELLKTLLLISQRQLELVEKGKMDMLIQHLGLRQQLWNTFELLEQQLAPHKKIPSKNRVWQSAEERLMIEAALNRCEELLKKILENDQLCLTKTAEQKEEAEKALEK